MQARSYDLVCPVKFESKPCFDNASIKPPVRYKPHICIREGWWRVSPMNVKSGIMPAQRRWGLAHDFACNANSVKRFELYAGLRHDDD